MERHYCLKTIYIFYKLFLYIQLKLFLYSYFFYDNADLPYAVAITWLYYVCFSFYYVL